MNRWFLRFFFCLFSCLFSHAQEIEEIQIQLPTASVLETLYLGKIEGKDPSFNSLYLAQLEEILLFDFNHNGSTSVVTQSPERERQLKTPTAFWKKEGVSYVVSCKVQERSLHATLFTSDTAKLQTFNHIPLTGELASDRRQIHKLADSIHKILFQEEGIASTQILFAYKNQRENSKEWTSEIWECDYDGANPRQLTHERSYCVTPVSMPQRLGYIDNHFLYVSYKIGQPKIYVGDRKGGTSKRLVDLRGNQLLPAVSSQRDKVAFICDAGGRTDLFLQSFDPKTGQVGKPIQLYSHPRSTQASPTFSPDGSQIAFVSDKDGGMRIFLIGTKQTEKRANAILLTKQNRENTCPAWSPDGAKLAYSAKTNGVRQIWIYDFATQEERQLTTGPGHKENPSWASNSRHIVFNSSDGAISELYLVNLNQPEVVKINPGPGQKHYPSWARGWNP